MDSITISVSDLEDLVSDLKNDGMKYVTLSILEEDELEGERIPPSLSATGYDSSDMSIGTDYDDLEAIE